MNTFSPGDRVTSWIGLGWTHGTVVAVSDDRVQVRVAVRDYSVRVRWDNGHVSYWPALDLRRVDTQPSS